MMRSPTLDIDLLRAFVAVAEQAGFTSAGAALGATQSAMSVRIRKLEDRLGERLLERSPQAVALTHFGEDFIVDARRILETHDEAAQRLSGVLAKPAFKLGVSDHAAAACLPAVLSDLQHRHPDVQFLVTVFGSAELYSAFSDGRFDAAVMRRAQGDDRGKALFRDSLKWAAAQGLRWSREEPLPLVSLASPCSLRAVATTALSASGIRWKERFVGTSVSAVQAAVSAGLGVACLDSRNVPSDCSALEFSDGLPVLPSTEIVIHHRHQQTNMREIAQSIEYAFSALADQSANSG